MPDPLSPEHRAHLEGSAVDIELAVGHGVRSVLVPDDLPDELRSYGEAITPGILFPWHSPSGITVPQLRPDVPFVGADGRARKYIWPTGSSPVFDIVSNGDANIVVLCEGAKKALAVASYRPGNVQVYAVIGAWSWLSNGAPIPDLEVVEDADVVVIFDADLHSNPDVHEAAKRLQSTCDLLGAREVRFADIGGTGKAGIDDVLAQLRPEKRAAYVDRLIKNARSKLPARPKARKPEVAAEPIVTDDRPLVDVSVDRWDVSNRITGILTDRWDADRLFNHGDVISQRRGHTMHPLDKGTFNDIVGESMRCGAMSADSWSPGPPDTWTRDAVLSRASTFSPLIGIARTPFVRIDGTICTTPGYDEISSTFVVLDEALVDLPIPETPSPSDVAQARSLLVEEWLGDMPFPDEASRANALGLVLTPLVRGLVPLVPLAVVDGLQMGVGKNLLADCVAILATGSAAEPLPWAGEEEEQRKALTSAYRTGADLFVFDEAHIIYGASLARALTATTWKDRILGVSTMAAYPNRITWVSLGNNVQLQGDLARRVYRIRLHPTDPHPENRPESDFAHPDLRAWTHEHRPELLTAALTLVRAWQVAGQPRPSAGVSFGSFEAWQRIVGGILETAGQEAFLTNTTKWRSESDYDGAAWVRHLRWLHETFGGAEFTSQEARSKLVVSPDVDTPPIEGEPTSRGYTKALGQAYARITERWFDDYQLVRRDTAHGHVAKWKVETRSGNPPVPPAPEQGPEPEPEVVPPLHQLPPTVDTLVFDIETADAHDLWRYGPGFVRLIGCQVNGEEEPLITPNVDYLVDLINAAGTIVGHNIMGFDLLALARYHGLDIHRLVQEDRVFDTKLVAFLRDPPTERMKAGQIEKAYSLQTLTGAKTGDIKKLAKKHGGYDQIPITDFEFREYLRGDVLATLGLADRLWPTGATPLSAYESREHRIAALAAQISLNGFRVDVPLLEERIEAGRRRKEAGLAQLMMQYDLPTTLKSGKPCKSPQATEAGKLAIAQAFRDLGVELPRTETEAPALGREALDDVIENNPNHLEVIELAELIKGLNGERTVYQTVHDHLVGDRVHPQIDMRQVSGRWSITKPGLTVMGKRGGRHVEREIFLPEPGEVIIAVDLAQVDARAIAAHCQDPAYIAMFDPGRDLHTEIAERVWGDAGRREDAKAIGHGWNYGMGPRGLARNAGVSIEEAEYFDNMMSESFPRLVQWREDVRHIAESGTLLDNGFGRKMRPNPDRAWTQGPALMGQGTARDILMQGLLRLTHQHQYLPWLRAVVHDEVVLSVPEEAVDQAIEVVIDALSFNWAPPGAEIKVPIIAGLAGPPSASWGAVYRKEEL